MKTKEDFLTNPEFVRWVRFPDAQLHAYWEKWIKANPEHLEELKKAKHFLLMVKYKDIQPPEGLKEEILHQLLRDNSHFSKISQPKARRKANVRSKTFWEEVSQFYRIAAILVLSFSFGWMLIPAQQNVPEPLVTAVRTVIHKSTTSGEKLQVTLPDGTRVWLNSVSELWFPEAFDSLERRVRLLGEAFFEVEKDRLKPFRVMTNELVTTALGTSFNINAKQPDNIKISLLTGKVKIASEKTGEERYLDPGEVLDYHKVQKSLRVRRFDPYATIGWKEGRIVFREASLSQVVGVLEEWYGVNISVSSNQKIQWKFSGEYQKQTLENVLESISYIQGFEYKINNKLVTFKF